MKLDITETTKDVIASFGDVLGVEALAKAKTKDKLIKAFETARIISRYVRSLCTS